MEPTASGAESPVLRTPRSFLLDAAPLPADDAAPAQAPSAEQSDSFTLIPPVSEVVKMRRAPAGEMPPAERGGALREAALRASRAPAVEIIARLSSERTKLKGELVQAQRERDEVLRQLQPLRTKLVAYESTSEPFALSGDAELVKSLRAELAKRDEEREAQDAKHEELARRAVERLRAERAELDARMNELAAFRVSLAERNEEIATLRADLEASDAQLAAKCDETAALRAEAAQLRAEVVATPIVVADRAEIEAALDAATSARAEAAAFRAEAESLRAELAAREELLATKERIDAEAREADAAAIRAQELEIEQLRAGLEAAAHCTHEAEIARLEATLEDRSAEVEGLRAALEAASVPCGHDATIDALRAEVEAELAKRTADFAEHCATRDELDRLRRHCASLEQESVRAAALQEKLAALEKDHAALRALAETKPSPALEAREERTARASRALAIGFGSAVVFANPSPQPAPPAPAPRRTPRRFDDLAPQAKPYPSLDPRPQKSAARMERALRSMDRKIATLARLIKKNQLPLPTPPSVPAPAPVVSAPAPKPRGASPGGGMFAKGGGGMLGALIQANLALRASADNSSETTEKRGNQQ